MDQQLQAQAIALRDLLSDPDKWTTTTLARDKFGANCHPCSEEANSFCLVGGTANVARLGCEGDTQEVYTAVADHPLGKALVAAIERRATDLPGGESQYNGIDKVYWFNDSLRGLSTSHRDVRQLLDDVVHEVSK